jgi:hypothetical protein
MDFTVEVYFYASREKKIAKKTPEFCKAWHGYFLLKMFRELE